MAFEHLTDEQKEKLYIQYRDELIQKEISFEKKLSPEQKKLLEDVRYTDPWGRKKTSLVMDMIRMLSEKYKKPSDMFRGEFMWLVEEWVLPCFREHFFYAVDNCVKWQKSDSYYRRSYRTATYSLYIEKMLGILRSFNRYMCMEHTVEELLLNKLSDKEYSYSCRAHYGGALNEFVIAYELDNGNKAVEQALTDILMGEDAPALSRTHIRGIFLSSNAEMHRLLGKLLLAARLQEGLRQVICESADEGTVEGFTEIIRVITENDLIRFSAVKRAVGTWTGLMTPDSADLDRISGKTMTLISECLSDSAKAEEYIFSDDCMKIYIGLWAVGARELAKSSEYIERISESGSKHQILAAGHYLRSTEHKTLMNINAKRVLKSHLQELDIAAVYLPLFMPETDRIIRSDNYEQTKRLYFPEGDICEYYDMMKTLYDSIPKKKLEFSPCIFPWHSEELNKSHVITRMSLLAKVLNDEEKLDFCCTLIKEIDSAFYGDREKVLNMLLKAPQNAHQRRILTQSLADRETDTANTAAILIKYVQLEEENYLQMEDMLKYKSAAIRANLLELLYKQSDKALFSSVQRLLSDKKEEKRTAALDIVMTLQKDESRQKLFNDCRSLVENMPSPTAKERILLEGILGKEEKAEQRQALFTDEDRYIAPAEDTEFTKQCLEVFLRYFPESKLGTLLTGKGGSFLDSLIGNAKKALSSKESSCTKAVEHLRSLDALIEKNADKEFTDLNGEPALLGNDGHFTEKYIDEDGRTKYRIPFISMWEDWYSENSLTPEDIRRIHILMSTSPFNDQKLPWDKYIAEIFGDGYEGTVLLKHRGQCGSIMGYFLQKYSKQEDAPYLSGIIYLWYLKCLPDSDFMIQPARVTRGTFSYTPSPVMINQNEKIGCLLSLEKLANNEHFDKLFPLIVAAGEKTFRNITKDQRHYSYYVGGFGERSYRFMRADPCAYLVAAHRGLISRKTLLHRLFQEDMLEYSLSQLSTLITAVRDSDRDVSNRRNHGYRRINGADKLKKLVGNPENYDEEYKRLCDLVSDMYETVVGEVLSVELNRGDSPTKYSEVIPRIERIYGAEYFTKILAALGKDTLDRSTYFYGDKALTKRSCLSMLLAVCIPFGTDTAEELSALMKASDISEKRLVEAALYSPEWLPLAEEILGWEGFQSACYYFMAHMNEQFDDRRAAMIAKYTPLSPGQLYRGAFDIKWFRSAYKAMGEKRFDLIYNAAKYISDGTKHSRARKYADAVLGKLNSAETEAQISDKRNKDLLMAYALIPLNGDKELRERYLFLQKFLKESKKFGAQRIQSERIAFETALDNLALNAGYTDTMRLTLRMEGKIAEDNAELFEEHSVEGVTLKLTVDDNGKTEIVCTKDGKALKSVPAKLKKNEYVLRLTNMKKQLTEQFRRTKTMLEQAMEDCTEFSAEELSLLAESPVVAALLDKLVFKSGDNIGFLKGMELISCDGGSVKLSAEDALTVAHPCHIYAAGNWSEYQRYIFSNGIVQPFKQVFRELYIKTAEEALMPRSMRYSGNQIQPKKAAACLKTRRWIADVENGMQKVFYKEDIVASMYAMADWFSPADIEAPTLEWVEFFDRRNGKPLDISNVPDVIFSEVMRDVDLAVSVAHAGGVDPETSHSTIEMRAALLEFTLPLFKLKNVRIEGSHAHIEGSRASYNVHLGSGVIHKKGGAMIAVLPVHSQHRGRLFLPFADDDPKTAEIITKVLLFADDKKIKDPYILDQI